MSITKGCRVFMNNCYIHEQILIGSAGFIFLVLLFDCWFKNLPLSGYGIIFLSILTIGCTSVTICHEIQKVLTRLPQDPQEDVKSRLENWCSTYSQKKVNDIFNSLFNVEISSFKYHTSLNEQMRLLIKDIERDYVKTWYAEVSVNPSFLFDFHLLLEEVLFKLLAKLKASNWKHIVKGLLFVYLNHLQEFKRSKRRTKNRDFNSSESKHMTVHDVYRYCHPGSLSDHALNHYLSKVLEIILREFAPHDFVASLESSILSRILARKMLKTLIFNVEDPAWIFIRLLYLFSHCNYVKLMEGRTYFIKELTVPIVEDEANKYRKKPTLLSRKSNMSGNIFDRTLGSKVFKTGNGNNQKKEALSLPLTTSKQEPNISSVLGSLISSTAAPLLPDNMSLCYQPLNKMWLSPVTELKQEITESVVNPFLKTIAEGLKIDNKEGNGLKEKFLLSRNKGITRSKSSDSMSVSDDLNPPVTRREVSVGEELNENVFAPEESGRRLVKTHSFDAGSSDDVVVDGIDDNLKGDVSPVYEEPEDFATTIAKLRSVLQQRESSSTLSDKSNPSLESQETISKENTIDLGEKSDLPVDPGGPFPELSVVACDIPSDGRPFVNVSIPKTEVHESSGSPYVLYSVQYDGIYLKQEGDESQLVLQTTIVKRRFQEFLNLQTRLEENSSLRQHLKGIKGLTKGLLLPFSTKIDDATTASRRPVLESYLQQLCAKLEIASSPALQEFLGYGSSGVTSFGSKDSNSSIQKFDKFFSTKVTGVFNSIKTVLPSFEGNTFLPPTSEAKEAKPIMEQNLLQGFLSFGNKSEDLPPIVLNYIISDATGNALTDDVRHLLAEKSDCIEDALDVLDSSDWLTEEGECHVVSTMGCAWRGFKDAVIDDDLDKFDMDSPVFNLFLDILCEILESSDCWITKEPTVHLLKVTLQHFEKEAEIRLSELDWDRICGNLLRLVRAALFTQSPTSEPIELIAEEVQAELYAAILAILPGTLGQIIGSNALNSAVKLILDSLSYCRCNRDALLRFVDILLSQILSCPHLSPKVL